MTSIRAIEGALASGEEANAELARAHPDWEMELVAEVSGIESRRVSAPGETAFDLSTRACEALLARPEVELGDVDAVLYCTQTPDHPSPGNAHLLHRQLGLRDEAFAFDFNLGCSGFVYGLGLADALIRAGTVSGVLLVTAETPSKWINPGDRAMRVLFGDGAAVAYLSAGDEGEGRGRLTACELRSHGEGFEHSYVPAGGARLPAGETTKEERVDASGNVRSAEDSHMDGTALWGFVSSAIPSHVEEFLARQRLSIDDIDLFIFHQGSRLILDSLRKALGVPPERMYRHMREIGNLSSSSIPLALNAALADGSIAPGSRVLLCGYGAGISYGSAVVEF